MEIRFSKHAIRRCYQQKISVREIERHLKKLPPFYCETKWRLKSGDDVAIQYRNDGREYIWVKTVISKEKRLRYKRASR